MTKPIKGPSSKESKRGSIKTGPRPHLNEQTRAILTNVASATDLMMELDDEEILKRECYFSRYGRVKQLIISSRHSSFQPRSQHIQVYVTYEDCRDAAFAIMALNGLRHHGSAEIKAHFGTSKYCKMFLMDRKCSNDNCFLLHKEQYWNLDRNQVKNTLEEQFDEIEDTIKSNVMYYIGKEYKQFQRRNDSQYQQFISCQCAGSSRKITFPTIKQTIQNLIDDGVIAEEEYQSLKKEFKLSLKVKRENALALSAAKERSAKTSEEKIQVQDDLKPKIEERMSASWHSTPLKTSRRSFESPSHKDQSIEDASLIRLLEDSPSKQVIEMQGKGRRKYVRKDIFDERKRKEKFASLVSSLRYKNQLSLPTQGSLSYLVGLRLLRRFQSPYHISNFRFTWQNMAGENPFDSAMQRDRTKLQWLVRGMVSGG